ncbi:hypothetical protein EVAR_39917_1 [Eumeta japonica]|uniref:Uncharacterized protein n=1 Tax=Eumeta variegata TaxID=151549 RepID=A0A4C1WM25_EUMVA|nr:hypothetical protein EVAR_39917_1 [Eumeta japonica]
MGRWSKREIDASQADRLGRSCLSIARSALSLARSAQAERDNESCFFRGKLADEPSESRHSSPLMDIRNPKGVTSALSASRKSELLLACLYNLGIVSGSVILELLTKYVSKHAGKRVPRDKEQQLAPDRSEVPYASHMKKNYEPKCLVEPTTVVIKVQSRYDRSTHRDSNERRKQTNIRALSALAFRGLWNKHNMLGSKCKRQSYEMKFMKNISLG